MRFAKDSWTSKTDFPHCFRGTVLEHDKLQHLLGGVLMGFVAAPLLIGGLFVALLAAVVWEIKDGYMYFETFGPWGGDGFSWRDMLATWAGSITGWYICGMALSLL